jgi:membrane protein implicated in regulation of membrane protease activity
VNNVYFWLGLGFALMALETVVPGAFILWFGLAGLVMGGLVWLLPNLSLLIQAIIFGVLSLLMVQVYRIYFKRHEPQSQQPLLNQRAEQYVGRTFVLATAIENGFGSIRIGDAIWAVAGPELPAGAKIEIYATDGTTLRVRSVI